MKTTETEMPSTLTIPDKIVSVSPVVPRLRVLMSYWYFRNTDIDSMLQRYFVEPYPEIFADSGAFSAMTQGGNVDIKDYIAWVRRWRHRLTTYVNLDVIKDAEKTWENQKRMEDAGLTPLPAFHILEDFRWLDHYVSLYPYIALGVAGMQQRTDSVMRWLVKCFKIAQGKSVFHGFALTSWQVMKSFPWYSVDSSSWGKGFRFGRIPIFDPKRGGFTNGVLGDPKTVGRISPIIRDMGFDPADFYDRNRNERAKIAAISALSFIRAETWLQNRWGKIDIPGNPINILSPGIKIYLVDTTTDIKDIRSAMGVLHG